MEYLLDKDKLHKIYDQSPQKAAHKRVKYVPSPRNEYDLSQKDFNSSVGKNYYEDSLQQNKAVPQNQLQLSIQKMVAEMSQKSILISQEH